jgi:hypothetical protein
MFSWSERGKRVGIHLILLLASDRKASTGGNDGVLLPIRQFITIFCLVHFLDSTIRPLERTYHSRSFSASEGTFLRSSAAPYSIQDDLGHERRHSTNH